MSMENDIILIYFEDQPMTFARIEEIRPDIKKNWYLVRLLFLQIPLQTVTWILRDIYIQGEEFTMGKKKMRLEKVVAPREEIPDAPSNAKKIPKKGTPKTNGPEPAGAKIVSLADRKPGKAKK